MNSEHEDLTEGFYYLHYIYEPEPTLVHGYYCSDMNGEFVFGFNTHDGGGILPLSDLSIDTTITRVNIFPKYSCDSDQSRPVKPHLSGGHGTLKSSDLFLDVVKTPLKPIINCEISLPYITDEMFEEFGETDLMTWDREKNRPHWTQTAVDFVCELRNSNTQQKTLNWKPSNIPHKTSIHNSIDIYEWAEYFLEVFPNCGADVHTMAGWFANVMMARHDYDMREKD